MTTAKFYQGIDTLDFKSNLTVYNVGPRGMVITGTEKTAWVGSYTTNDVVVIEKGTQAGNYQDFVDQSGSIPSSYRAVSLRAI